MVQQQAGQGEKPDKKQPVKSEIIVEPAIFVPSGKVTLSGLPYG
jgi:hypothetical protein